MLRIQLLGSPKIDCDNQPLIDLTKSPNLVRLFAFLVTRRAQPQARGTLATLFYPDQNEATARRNLNQLFYRLRGVIAPCACFISTPQTIQFDPHAEFHLDIDDFERCAAQPNVESLERAVALYTGDFLDGFYDDWCVAERERLHEIYVVALGKLTHLYKAAGDFDHALSTAHRWVQADGFNEDAHAQLVALLVEGGRIGEAREQWARYEAMWRDELKLEPSPRMRGIAFAHALVVQPASEATVIDDLATMLESAQTLASPAVGDSPEAIAIREQFREQIIDHADKLGDVFKAGFAHTDALRHYAVALDALRQSSQPCTAHERELAIRRKCDEAHDLTPHRDQQELNLQEMQAVAEQLNEASAKADVWLRRAWLDLRRNRFDEAIRFAQKASVLSRKLAPAQQALSQRVLGLVLFESSYYAEAQRCFAEAAQLDKQLQNGIGLQADYVNLAAIANAQGKHCAALDAIERARAITDAHTPTLRARTSGTLGQVLTKLNQLDEASPYLRESLALTRSLGDHTWECWLAGRTADLYFRRGETGRAVFFAKHYEAQARDLGETWSMADLAELLARFHIGIGDGTEALCWAQRALEVADANDLWRYQVRGAWRCAQAYQLLGETTLAGEFIATAMRLLRQRDEVIEEADDILRLAEHSGMSVVA